MRVARPSLARRSPSLFAISLSAEYAPVCLRISLRCKGHRLYIVSRPHVYAVNRFELLVALAVVLTPVNGVSAPSNAYGTGSDGKLAFSAIDLKWEAPSVCPSVNVIREEILRLVAPRVEFSSPIRATARTQVDERGAFVLQLETHQSGIVGERVFSGKSCQAVADAAIVTLALSLDPNLKIPNEYRTRSATSDESAEPKAAASAESAVHAASEPAVLAKLRSAGSAERKPAVAAPSKPKKSTGSAPLVPEPQPGAPSRSDATQSVTSGFVRATVGWRWGALPGSAGELGLGLGLQRSRLSGHVSLSLSPTAKLASSADQPTAGGKFSMRAAEAMACWALMGGSWRVAPCLGLAFTYLGAEGVGVTPLRNGRLYWTSPLLAIQSSYRLGARLALFGGLAGYWAAQRPEAYLNDGETLFVPAELTFLAAGGVEVKIW